MPQGQTARAGRGRWGQEVLAWRYDQQQRSTMSLCRVSRWMDGWGVRPADHFWVSVSCVLPFTSLYVPAALCLKVLSPWSGTLQCNARVVSSSMPGGDPLPYSLGQMTLKCPVLSEFLGETKLQSRPGARGWKMCSSLVFSPFLSHFCVPRLACLVITHR